MTLTEIILFTIVLILLVGVQVLKHKIRNPGLLYLKVSAAIALMLLIWLFGKDSQVSIRIILSVLVVTNLYRDYFDYQKNQSNK